MGMAPRHTLCGHHADLLPSIQLWSDLANEKLSSPMGEPPNSSRNSTGGTEQAGQWEALGNLPSESTAILLPILPSVLTPKASYPWVEGSRWETTEEALSLLKKCESCDRNVPMVMFFLQ